MSTSLQGYPRVLIADDHMLVAEALRRLLEPEYEIVGVVADGRALVNAACSLKPDIVIVDIGLPLLNGLDASVQVKKQLPRTKVIFLTMNSDLDICAEAFRRGASAFVLKSEAASALVSAMRKVVHGESYVSPTVAEATARTLLTRREDLEENRLTARQREVLQLLAEGKTMREVATVLNLTTRTVSFHKYRIMKALRLKKNEELVRYAIRNHLIQAGIETC
jgi:DNA-binding NarL/FixJ family response regulator